MKKTNTHIIRTLALSLLIVVTLASFTNVLSVRVVSAQAAGEVTAEDKAKTAEEAKTAAEAVYNTETAAAKSSFDQALADAGTDAAKGAQAKSEYDVKMKAAGDKRDAAVGASPGGAAGSGASAEALTTLGGQTVGDVLPSGNNDIIVMLSKVLAIVLSMISHLLWPLLMFAGGLMKSDFLYTGAIDLKLTEMWIQVRNLVNIAYVLLLLAVALYNVVGLGETVSMLELKKALPKIIIGLVLVNFSYAGVKVVLDVVNVGTTFAFSIGRSDARLTQATLLKINEADGPICETLGIEKLAAGIGTEAKDKAIATECAGKKTGAEKETCMKQVALTYAPKTKSNAEKNAMCVPDKDGKLGINPQVKQYLKSWNVDSSLMIIAIKFMNIQDLPKVSEAAAKGGLASLTINMLFSVIMFLIYAVSFIVLIVILFARAAILWMIIIFSPAIVFNATFAIPGAGGHTSKIVKTLISPMLIGFVLSIGFILLATMQNINYNGQGALASNAPTSSIDTFQDLLVAIGSVVFLWTGIQAASSDTIADGVTKTITDSAQSAGTWLAKAPFKYAPLFQVATPHAGHHELQDMGKIGVDLIPEMLGEITRDSDNQRRQNARLALNIGGSTRPFSEAANADALRSLMGARNKTADHYLDNDAPKKELTDAIKRLGKDAENLKDPKFKQMYEDVEGGRPLTRRAIEEFTGATPAATPAAATPATPATPQTPVQISATMKSDPKMSIVVSNINNSRPTPPKDVAIALKTYNTNLANNGVADEKIRGEHIARHFKDNNSGTAWNTTKKGEIMARLTASRAEIKSEMGLNDGAVDSFLKAIKDGMDGM